MSEMGDAIGFRQRKLSKISFEAFELEIVVNYRVTLEQRMAVSHEISRADRCLFGSSS